MTDPFNQSERRTPDPTVLTTEALSRAVAAERDYVDGQISVLREQLRGIDTATKLLNEQVNQAPTTITQAILHLRELMDEKFFSIETQFRERDTRQEREARDNKVAVDAAFAAQKEAAAKQNESNTLAIAKSESATAETINKLAELFKTTTDGLAGKIDDVKERVATVETLKLGAQEKVTDQRQTISNAGAVIGVLIGFVTLIGILAAAGAFK